MLKVKVDDYIAELMRNLGAGGLREYIEKLEPITEHNYTMNEIAAALLKMKAQKKHLRKSSFDLSGHRVLTGIRFSYRRKKQYWPRVVSRSPKSP